MLVTRYVTRESRRESQPPTRTEPILTGPTAKTRVETSIISSSYVGAGARAADSPSPTESRTGMMPLREGWAA